MHSFELVRARTASDVFAALAAAPQARLIAGGTNLVDLMKLGVEAPDVLIDINQLDAFRAIEPRPDGGIRIGALATNSAVAWHPEVRARFPVVSQAILAGATTQLRNMATVGGNLLQRTRCPYFADLEARCNKRTPGRGCDALDGHNRMSAVLGVSSGCIAANPSDLCVALRALDAVVHVRSAASERSIPFAHFHKTPGDTPHIEVDLGPGELITAIDLPPLPLAAGSTYRKLRDRTSYAFALVSVAAAIAVDDGVVRDVRLALGGVGSVPWRDAAAEDAMRGAPAEAATFARAADVVFATAVPRPGNAFKIELAKRAIVRGLGELAEIRP